MSDRYGTAELPRRNEIQQIRSRPLITSVDKDIGTTDDVISEVVATQLAQSEDKQYLTLLPIAWIRGFYSRFTAFCLLFFIFPAFQWLQGRLRWPLLRRRLRHY